MNGRKSLYDITWIGARRLLRSVTAKDDSVDAIPTADLITLGDKDYGRNGAIRAFVVFPTSGMTSVVVDLYIDVTGEGDWCFISTTTVTKSVALSYNDLVPGTYALCVSAFTGNGEVDIHVQHT